MKISSWTLIYLRNNRRKKWDTNPLQVTCSGWYFSYKDAEYCYWCSIKGRHRPNALNSILSKTGGSNKIFT